MATLTNEQIEQKKQLLAEKMNEMKALHDELVQAGAIELSEDELNQAAGGYKNPNAKDPIATRPNPPKADWGIPDFKPYPQVKS